MLNNLFRKYNQNKRGVWTIIIVIVFSYIVLQAIYGLLRNNKEKRKEELINQINENTQISSNNNLENNSQNINSKITTDTTRKNSKELIEQFVKYCNNNQIEDAYSMISKDCKSVLFPNINTFKNNYIKKIFNQNKTAKVEKEIYGNGIYKVTYMNNILQSGGKSDKQIIDYIYVTDEGENKVLSLNKFLYIKEIGIYVLIIDESEIKQNIYNLLSQKYIEEKSITIDNLYENIKTINSPELFVPLEISLIQDEKIKSFAVHGITEKQNNFQKIDDVFFIVNIDMSTSLFSIEPIYEKYNSIEEIKMRNFDTNIKENNENKIIQTVSNYEESVKEYIDLYKRLALGAPEQMYNLLDEEYRNTKFRSVENFKNYIAKNKQKIIGIKAEKYQATKNDEYTQFVCIDQNENYYIFREYAVLNYKVILDTYTIDLPEFTEKYAKATNEEKVLLNIQKCFEAINNKDYEYVYGKLDETFKKNNFKNESGFENYIKNNFFEKNKMQPIKAEKQGEFYVYDLNIKDNSKTDSKSFNKKFIMQLKDNTDFVMSFNI